MLNRSDFSALEEWYHRGTDRKPLLVRGARQVGKTTLVRMLAGRLGAQLVELNMEKPWRFASTLTSLDPMRTVEAVEFELNIDIDPLNTIVFSDEVQACPDVLPMLRYFRDSLRFESPARRWGRGGPRAAAQPSGRDTRRRATGNFCT